VLRRIAPSTAVSGIKARNREQKWLFDALNDPAIHLVTVSALAGSGKTLLSTAAGLQSVMDDRKHKKVLITRPVVSMGNELGFLPGSSDEKLLPWVAPFLDAIEVILGDKKKSVAEIKPHQFLLDKGYLEFLSLEHIRGRSIQNSFIIIDEAQNLNEHELRTIITRAGNGTKIVLLGDLSQIDSPKLNRENNGLAYAIKKFRTSPLAAHITLTKCERSPLANEAVRLLC
jgi:PhoH-like ATPase